MLCNKKTFGVILALIFLVSLSSVVQAEDPSEPRFRAVNAAPGLPDADVYVGNTLYFRSVRYGQVSNYAPVDPGGRSLEVRPSGIKDSEPNPVLTKVDWTFNIDEQPDNDYTMVIVGSPENNETPLVFRDDNRTPLPPGEMRVRFIHVSREAPALEACLGDECRTLTYPKESDYITLEAVTYELKVRLIGTDELYVDILPIRFQAGEVYSIFILAPPQGQVRPLIVVQSDTGQPGPPYEPKPAGYAPSPADGQAPLYPPATGAFLSPTAIALFTFIFLVIAAAAIWVARRQFQKT